MEFMSELAHSSSETGLFGVAWQTKVERKRRGTRFAVPAVGFRKQDWLLSWWKLFSDQKLQDRDFWFAEVLSFEQNMLGDQPITYERGLKCFKYALSQALRLAPALQIDISMPAKDMIAILEKVTWHTCRVTLLSAAVHEQKDAQAIALQANWKNPSYLVSSTLGTGGPFL